MADKKHSREMMREAQKHYWIQKELGRPIRKYNLLICRDDGDWFSSEDNLKDGLIMSVLKKCEEQEPFNCGGWRLMYLTNALKKPTAIQGEYKFFCYIMLSDIRTLGGEESVFDKFQYLNWKEGHL